MKISYQKFITEQNLKENQNSLYIFGDNKARKGYGGQAKVMRGKRNSFGIITKLKPTNDADAFLRDSCPEHLEMVKYDFDLLYGCLYESLDYERLVIPKDGIGTGRARLKENAPKILEYINKMLFDIIPNTWEENMYYEYKREREEMEWEDEFHDRLLNELEE